MVERKCPGEWDDLLRQMKHSTISNVLEVFDTVEQKLVCEFKDKRGILRRGTELARKDDWKNPELRVISMYLDDSYDLCWDNEYKRFTKGGSDI